MRVKTAFFNASYARYDQCLMNRFKLVPLDTLAVQLEEDYLEMIASGMFTGEPPAFKEILDGLSRLERDINGA